MLIFGGRGIAPCSFFEEGELVLAVLELRRVDPAPVEERAVEAPLILDSEGPAFVAQEHGVLARHCDVGEKDVAVRGASDRRPTLGRVEALPRASTGADDERGPLEALCGRPGRLRHLLRGQRLRLTLRILRCHEGATSRAVSRRLRIGEPALRAVQAAHAVSVSAAGAAFAVRMLVSVSTSTESSTLFPPDF